MRRQQQHEQQCTAGGQTQSPARRSVGRSLSPKRRSPVHQVAAAWEQENVQQPHHAHHQPPSSHPAAAAAAPLAVHPAVGAAAAVEPSYAAAFSERLRGLEQKAVAREAYWRGVVTEVQRAHASDAAGLRMQCSRAVEAKVWPGGYCPPLHRYRSTHEMWFQYDISVAAGHVRQAIARHVLGHRMTQ
jgi:hypothetical protein